MDQAEQLFVLNKSCFEGQISHISILRPDLVPSVLLASCWKRMKLYIFSGTLGQRHDCAGCDGGEGRNGAGLVLWRIVSVSCSH